MSSGNGKSGKVSVALSIAASGPEKNTILTICSAVLTLPFQVEARYV